MGIIQYFRHTQQPTWLVTLACVVPLWLLAVAIMVEGFPPPPIPLSLALFAFFSASVIAAVLLWRRKISVIFLLYCGLPFFLLYTFDEISTVYKTQYILACTLFLTLAAVAHLRSQSPIKAWLFLLLGVVVTLLAAEEIGASYWDLVSSQGLDLCYPDCLPQLDQANSWWRMLISF